MHTPNAVIDQQAHLVNFRKNQILNKEGIRQIILRRNKLGDDFALCLQKTIYSDKYIKKIDISGNRITQYGLKVIMKLGLMEN